MNWAIVIACLCKVEFILCFFLSIHSDLFRFIDFVRILLFFRKKGRRISSLDQKQASWFYWVHLIGLEPRLTSVAQPKSQLLSPCKDSFNWFKLFNWKFIEISVATKISYILIIFAIYIAIFCALKFIGNMYMWKISI